MRIDSLSGLLPDFYLAMEQPGSFHQDSRGTTENQNSWWIIKVASAGLGQPIFRRKMLGIRFFYSLRD